MLSHIMLISLAGDNEITVAVLFVCVSNEMLQFCMIIGDFSGDLSF